MTSVFALNDDGTLTAAESVLDLGNYHVAVIPKEAPAAQLEPAPADVAPGAVGSGDVPQP